MRYRTVKLRSFRFGLRGQCELGGRTSYLRGLVAACVLSIFCIGSVKESFAAVLHHTFDGKAVFVPSNFPSNPPPPPFGLNVPNSANLAGEFWYDSSVAGVQGSTPSVMNYDQPFPLILTFAPGPSALTAAVTGYRIEVLDNSVQPGGVFDIVSLLYASDILPLSPFTVNGAPKNSGLIRINFTLPAGTLAGPILPPDFNVFTAVQSTNLFADTPTGAIDVIYTVRIPEPGSIALIAWGAVIAIAARKRLRLATRRA